MKKFSFYSAGFLSFSIFLFTGVFCYVLGMDLNLAVLLGFISGISLSVLVIISILVTRKKRESKRIQKVQLVCEKTEIITMIDKVLEGELVRKKDNDLR